MDNKVKVLGKGLSLVAAVAVMSWATAALADIKQVKIYKEAYSDAKPKCVNCHVDAMPKKGDGAHELNDYGKAVKEAAGEEEITAETYTKVGPAEDFKKAE